MIGDWEGETSLSGCSLLPAPRPPAVERAMGIKCETVNCAWEESVPGRSWRSTMLFVGRSEVEWRTGVDGPIGWREASRQGKGKREGMGSRPNGAKDLRGFKCALGCTEARVYLSCWSTEREEGVGNLLGYVGLSLPSEYEKGIHREAFEGRGQRGWRPCRYSSRHPRFSAGELEVMVVREKPGGSG